MYVSEGYKKVLGHGSPYIVIYFICPISVHYDGHVFSPIFVLLRVFFLSKIPTTGRKKEILVVGRITKCIVPSNFPGTMGCKMSYYFRSPIQLS